MHAGGSQHAVRPGPPRGNLRVPGRRVRERQGAGPLSARGSARGPDQQIRRDPAEGSQQVALDLGPVVAQGQERQRRNPGRPLLVVVRLCGRRGESYCEGRQRGTACEGGRQERLPPGPRTPGRQTALGDVLGRRGLCGLGPPLRAPLCPEDFHRPSRCSGVGSPTDRSRGCASLPGRFSSGGETGVHSVQSGPAASAGGVWLASDTSSHGETRRPSDLPAVSGHRARLRAHVSAATPRKAHRASDSGGPMDPQEGLRHPGAQVLGGEAPAGLQGGPSGPDVPTANVRAAQGDCPQTPALHPTQQGVPVGPNVVAGVSRGLERGLHVDRADA